MLVLERQLLKTLVMQNQQKYLPSSYLQWPWLKRCGSYQFRRKFTRAPASFSRLMDKVLDGLIGNKCLVNLDDVIIFGSSFEETLANLKLVMATDPLKVEKICNLSAPKDKRGIRSILGLGNYYKRFINSYCVIIAALQELLKKSIHFRWGDEQEQAFINKNRLSLN